MNYYTVKYKSYVKYKNEMSLKLLNISSKIISFDSLSFSYCINH